MLSNRYYFLRFYLAALTVLLCLLINGCGQSANNTKNMPKSDNIVKDSTFKQMKNVEISTNVNNIRMNKGKSSRWKEYFSISDLRYFNRRIKKELIYDFGYNYLNDDLSL